MQMGIFRQATFKNFTVQLSCCSGKQLVACAENKKKRLPETLEAQK